MEETENTPKKSQKLKKVLNWKIFDVLLILLLMAATVLFRLPSLSLGNINSEYQEYLRDENGYPYLNDPDSYFYARRTRDILESGDYRPVTPTSEESAIVRLDVKDTDKNYNLHPILSALSFRVVHAISGISFDKFIVFFAPFVFSLSVIPAYIFVKRHTDSRIAAITAGLLISVSPAFLDKTAISCFDTDLWLCVFPLTFVCLFTEALLAEKLIPRIIYIITSTIALCAFAVTWGAYSSYFYLIVAIFVVLFLLLLVKKRNFLETIKSKEVITCFICLICYTIVGVIVHGGIDTGIFKTITDIISGISSDEGINGWPSAGKFVAELSALPLESGNLFSANNDGIINSVGGIVAFVALTIIIAVLFVRYQRFTYREAWENATEEDAENERAFHYDLVFLSVLVTWTIGGLVSLIGGTRFSEIASIPTCIVLGLGVGYLHYFLKENHLGFIAIFAAASILVVPVIHAVTEDNLVYPATADALIDVSRYIRDDAGEEKDDSLIVSWWDNGYTYEYYSDGVRTLADGGSYNGELYVYLARIFMTSDPDESVESLEYLLDRANLNPKHIYLVVSEDMTRITHALGYYAAWGRESEYDYEVSFINKAATGSKKFGDYKFKTLIEDPTETYSTAIFRYDRDVD